MGPMQGAWLAALLSSRPHKGTTNCGALDCRRRARRDGCRLGVRSRSGKAVEKGGAAERDMVHQTLQQASGASEYNRGNVELELASRSGVPNGEQTSNRVSHDQQQS